MIGARAWEMTGSMLNFKLININPPVVTEFLMTWSYHNDDLEEHFFIKNLK